LVAAALPTAAAGATPTAPPKPVPVRVASTITPLASAARSGDVRTVRPASTFSMVGVRWTGAAPDRVEVRNRTTGGRWSGWTALDPTDAQPEIGRASTTTEPMWTGPSNEVQVRATRDGAAVTDGLQVVTLDPGSSPADPRPTVSAVPGRPSVVTRAGWGADESIMTWAPEYAWTTKAVTLHHTDGTNDYTCAQSASIVRGIYHYHAITNGWGDIGYNVLVDKCGTIFEGRKGGLDVPTIGAHAGGFNTYTFGISMLGEFTSVAPPGPTMESVAAMAAWKLGTSYRDPLGTTVLVSTGSGTSKYPAGTAVTLPTIFSHRDVGNTACPGNAAYAQLANIRNRVVQLAGDWRSSPVYAKWQAEGGETGWPLGVYQAEQPLPGGGSGAGFKGQGGATITSHPTAGTHYVRGPIWAKWVALGGVGYGYPTSDEIALTGGAMNTFQNGKKIYSSAAGGAHPVNDGPIATRWQQAGGPTGSFGFPVSDEYAYDGGTRRQDFYRAVIIYDPATATYTIVPRRTPIGG
jgi:uncharacterized protein with LGFP repeats